MLKFVICDDNVPILYKLKDILEIIFSKNDLDACVSFITSDIKELKYHVNHNDVDVLFLDIDLNADQNGIELAKEFRANNKDLYLIFITGHFEYILSAYECKTFDFIQKPFSQSKLERTILRLFDDINGSKQKFIKIDRKHSLINQATVNFIQKQGMKTIYYTTSGTIESYGSFNNLSKLLPQKFVRCHKSFIVNIDNISNVDLKTNEIFFKESSSSQCFIGPKYKEKLLEEINYGNNK